MAGLIIFLHGLTGSADSWGAVPDFVKKSPLGAGFEVASLEYSAKIFSRSDITTSAERVLTEIETSYGSFKPIYLVGHSLGGLIARELCKSLLRNGPDDILAKLPVVITVGTPLEGARCANTILRRIPFVSKKINQLANRSFVFDEYRVAIRVADGRSVERPKQLHIRIEDDGVIANHVKSYFTDDDFFAGVVPGKHTDFVSKNEDASYVANVILKQIGKAQNSLSAPNISKAESVLTPDLPDRLILIACSHGKLEGGEVGFRGPRPVDWIVDTGLRQRIFAKRSFIFSELRDARLADGFKQGGNRAHQGANQTLKYGPDLGANSVVGEEGAYLPAWKRYNGRLYVPVSPISWENYFANTDKVRVLIMSGLYGLIEPQEWIQWFAP